MKTETEESKQRGRGREEEKGRKARRILLLSRLHLRAPFETEDDPERVVYIFEKERHERARARVGKDYKLLSPAHPPLFANARAMPRRMFVCRWDLQFRERYSELFLERSIKGISRAVHFPRLFPPPSPAPRLFLRAACKYRQENHHDDRGFISAANKYARRTATHSRTLRKRTR